MDTTTNDRPAILAAAAQVADELGLMLGPDGFTDGEGRTWTMDALAPVIAARLAPVVGAVDGTPTPARAARLLKQLAKLRAGLGRDLRVAAEPILAEALHRIGVKVKVRAKSRGASVSTRTAALKAVDEGGPFHRGLLAALGLKESDLLDGAFVNYAALAERWIGRYLDRQRTAIRAAGLDPDRYAPERPGAAAQAAEMLVQALTALARQRALTRVDPTQLGADGLPILAAASRRGEVTGNVPMSVIRSAIGVAEGSKHVTAGATPDDLPRADDLPGAHSVEELVASELAEDRPTWTWVHGFYGDPDYVFDPHELLGAAEFTTADPQTDPDLANPDPFPLSDLYQPGDHDGCTCEWVLNA